MAAPSQIPGAGQWLAQQRQYLSAWQQAQAQAKAAQGNLANQYGFGADGSPDPLNTGGAFWQQQNREGQQVQQADSAIQSRGFNSGEGFGSQLEQPLRDQQGIADSRMLQNYLGAEGRINSAQAGAYNHYQEGMLQSLQNAIQMARRGRNFGTAGAPTGGVNYRGQNFDSRQGVINFLKQNKLGSYSSWASANPQLADYFIR